MSVKGHWDRTKDRKRARKTYAGINWRERMAKNIAVKKSVMYGEIDSSCCYELSYFEDIINDGEAESLILESWEKVIGQTDPAGRTVQQRRTKQFIIAVEDNRSGPGKENPLHEKEV